MPQPHIPFQVNPLTVRPAMRERGSEVLHIFTRNGRLIQPKNTDKTTHALRIAVDTNGALCMAKMSLYTLAMSDLPISTETVSCLVCGEKESGIEAPDLRDFEYGVPGTYQLRKCNACDQLFLSPRPTEADIMRCYPEDYHGYQTNSISKLYDLLTEFQMNHRFNKYLELLGKRKAAILDVGCGDGYVLGALKKRAPHWTLAGVELKREIAEQGQKQGFDIFCGTLEQCTFAPASFDLLIMNHLIEHLHDPLLTLKKAHELLKPGGYVIGEAPNFDSLDRRIAKKWWGGHHTPRHLFQFTPKTLSRLFAKAGLNTVRVSAEMHSGHWAGSVQNFLQDGRMPVKLHNGRAAYYPFLLAFFAIPNAFQYVFKKTGILSFIAHRPH